MANTKERKTVMASRVPERIIARVDAAARLRGITRSDYIREATVAQVERDFRAAVEESRHQVAEAR